MDTSMRTSLFGGLIRIRINNMAQLTRFEYNSKVGYKNENKDIIFEPQFDSGCYSFGSDDWVRKFAYGSVMKDKKCGIIREDGTVVIPLEYDDATVLFDDLFAIRKPAQNKSWVVGVVNSKGETVIPFEYKAIMRSGDLIHCFREAYSNYHYYDGEMTSDGIVYDYTHKSDDCWFNKEGVLVYNDNGVRSENGVIVTIADHKFGAVEQGGKIILDNKYDDIFCVSNKLFIIRVNEGENWKFGVINEHEQVVIPFEYKYIEYHHPSFFVCYKRCESKIYFGTFNHAKQCWENHTGRAYEYSFKEDESWYNYAGEFIHSGKGEVLDINLLSVNKGKYWGVYNRDVKRVVNFNYDHINYKCEKILVAKEGRVGVLNSDGSIVINPIYNSIECVNFSDKTYKARDNRKVFGKYSLNNIFSTKDSGPNLARATIYIGQHPWLYNQGVYVSAPSEGLNFDSIFILRSDGYEELFSIREGIIENSRFEQISQLTPILFAVRQHGKWGVFSANSNKVCISCDYDQIVYTGSKVVLLEKNGKWGAKSLVFNAGIISKFHKVDIPLEYFEIKELPYSPKSLYGVKVKQVDSLPFSMESPCEDTENYEYTIIDGEGKEHPGMVSMPSISSQFTIYRHDRVLCSIDDKYGFISLDGYISIPFKYDEIQELQGGIFSVRVGEAWGLLSLDKGEFVAVKYKAPIPYSCDGALVTDAISGGYGMLASDGTEKIPCIYEHLQTDEKYVYFGYNGYDYSVDINFCQNGNFFSKIDDATWGCMDKSGKVLIAPKYDCYKVVGDFILAGRDGRMLIRSQSCYGYEYDGLYDLYTSDGEMLLGGFKKFIFDEEHKVFKFFFGGGFVYDNDYDDYDFKEGMGRWIITDAELKSIRLQYNGKPYSFTKGAQLSIRVETNEDKTINYWPCPIEILFKNEPYIVGDYLIHHESGDYGNGSYFAVRINDGKESHIYDQMKYIGNNRFYVREGDSVGVVDFDNNIIIPIEYVVLTNPVENFVFAVKELEDKNCMVVLFNFNTNNITEHCAIANAKLKDVLSHMAYGFYMIYPDKEGRELSSISVFRRSIFDQDFQDKISSIEEGELLKKFSRCYWFSNHWRLEEDDVSEYGDSGSYDDDTDYDRDTWDAMTDGQYGDYPGLGVDYDGLGF